MFYNVLAAAVSVVRSPKWRPRSGRLLLHHRKEVAFMFVTWQDLLNLALVILGVVELFLLLRRNGNNGNNR